MKTPVHFLAVAATFALTGLTPHLWAATDAEAAAGRALVKRYADAVVGVELVVTVKVTMGDRPSTPRENKVEINGTVIAATGLTVASLSAIDPRAMIEAQRSALGAGGARMEIGETDFKEVKLRLADGTEVPARVVLKDADLDLAFIAPEAEAAGGRQFPHVQLEEAADAAVLGGYFEVSRAPKALQRTPTVRLVDLTGVVEKPRRLFLLSDYSMSCPVFDAQGRILGLTVRRIVERLSSPVVLPAADVADMARQAAAIKPAKTEAPADKPAEKTP